ncbi:UNVERIFIED_ORG: hypothetical protein M2414_002372 [Rahnella aquatilis]
MIKRLWASIKAFFYTPVAATESQPKENIVKLSLTSINSSQPADGVSPIHMLATATDDAGNPVANVQLNFSASGAIIDSTQRITDKDGRATVSLISQVAGSVASTVSTSDLSASVTALAVFTPVSAPGNALLDQRQEDPDVLPVKPSSLESLKDDFNKVVAFIEHGIEVLGKDAEADLVAMKNKFLG